MAILTQPRDRQVIQVRLEAVMLSHILGKRQSRPQIYSDDLPAGPANQVEMSAVYAQEFVAALTVARVNAGDQMEILQEVQGPVDG